MRTKQLLYYFYFSAEVLHSRGLGQRPQTTVRYLGPRRPPRLRKEAAPHQQAGGGRRRSRSPSATRVHIWRRHREPYSARRLPEDPARSAVILQPRNTEKMSQAELWERAIHCKPITSSHLLSSRHLSFSPFPFSVSDRSVNLLKMKHFCRRRCFKETSVSSHPIHWSEFCRAETKFEANLVVAAKISREKSLRCREKHNFHPLI